MSRIAAKHHSGLGAAIDVGPKAALPPLSRKCLWYLHYSRSHSKCRCSVLESQVTNRAGHSMSGSHACIDDQLDGILYHQSEFDVILAQHRSSLCSPGHGHGHLAASPSFEALRATCLQRPSSDLEHCVLACRQTVCTRSSLTSLSQKQRCPPRSIASAVPKFIEQEQIFNAENPSRQLYLSVQDQVYGTYGTRT
jgi:hypothetical protein